MIDSHGPPGGKPDPQRPDRTAAQKAQHDEALGDSFPASDPVSIVTSHQEDWDQRESK